MINEKRIYLLILFGSIFCLILSHAFFQNYLFMQPCEQCIYVRFAFCVLILACILLCFKFVKFLGFSLAFFGIFCGLKASLKLMQIHAALLSNNPFLASCSNFPHFAFNIPLDKFFPSLFTITGICGLDAPTPPSDVNLSVTQSFFVELYSQGWYLIPKYHFITMAEASTLIFALILLLLFMLFLKKLDLKLKFVSFILFLALIFLAWLGFFDYNLLFSRR